MNYRLSSLLTSTKPATRLRLSGLVIILGLLILLVHPFPESRTHFIVTHLSQMHPLSAADIQRAPLGSDALIEGQIAPLSPVSFRSFVVYVREEFAFKQGWSVRERVTPPFILAVPDGTIRVINNDYAPILRTLPVEWRPDFQRFTISEQYRGLVVNNPVVLIGTITQDQQGRAIRADYLGGGTRAAFGNDISHQFDFGADDANQLVGDGLLLLGGWVFLISAFQAFQVAHRTNVASSDPLQ